MAEHVVGDHSVLGGQANDLAAPQFFVQAHAVDQNHGLALAGRQVTGASRGEFSGEPNHGALLQCLFIVVLLNDYWAFSAASSSRSM
jgi:hypothetical protein